MKIEKIETIPVDIPRVPRSLVVASYSALESAKFVIVIVKTDEGVEGYGEASPEYQWTGEDDKTCCHYIQNYLAPALLGSDPLRVQHALTRMDKTISHNFYAKAAIEMALWDIVGKAAGRPLSEIWGGRVRDAVPVKFVVSGAPQRAAEMAKELVAEGFRYIKIKTGLDLAGDLARVRAVRTALGGAVPIGIDSNMGWTFREALTALPALEELGVAFIEQPFARYPRDALLDFKRRSRIPLVAHESLFTLNDALELLNARAVDVWAITPATHGGYLPTRDILGLARAGGIPCLLGSTLELGVHSAFMGQIGLTSPSLSGEIPSDLIGPFYYENDVINERFELADGFIRPPEGPGIGVTLNWDVINLYRSDR
jgi:L-alanine-DL-glutamate epimerase-like enolase superfamily enzyme